MRGGLRLAQNCSLEFLTEHMRLFYMSLCAQYLVTCPILTNSAWRASSFLRADFGDSGNTSLKDRLFNMFWGEKGT